MLPLKDSTETQSRKTSGNWQSDNSQGPSKGFQAFVASLGPKATEELIFDHVNKFVKFHKRDFLDQASMLSYYAQIFEKQTSSAKRRKWHSKDKFILLWTVSKYCDLQGIRDFKMTPEQWSDVAEILAFDREFLLRKWICMLRHTTCLFQWSKAQDTVLEKQMRYMNFETKWSELSILIFLQSGSCSLRTCKDIRQRWKNYLDPSLKRNYWTSEEDDLLIDLIQAHGKKWSFIAKMIKGRTENQVKNRFITLFKKRMITLGPKPTKLLQNQVEKEIKTESPGVGSFFTETTNSNPLNSIRGVDRLEAIINDDDQVFVERVFQKQPFEFFSELSEL